ncbi:hypothetical protein M405DRAFT_95226 [Rhizopogon salebrosus TDB-379]|nr:hypothetical protein M405DRAFT_95226 [Rhizopogon salebrosus TDB-379]
MHQAICTSDILQAIFANLPDPSLTVDSLSQTSLAALARTCKAFYEPAMDLLWADTFFLGISPLLGCVTRLHPLIYGARKVGAEPPTSFVSLLSFYTQNFREFSSRGLEPLSEHEAHQFLRHAARVRSLRIWTDQHFHLLTILPIDTCLFPRLLQLIVTWGHLEDRSAKHFRRLLSPMLRRCDISQRAVSLIHPDFKFIAACSPAVESLSIQTKVHTANGLMLLSETICSCKHLRYLSCPPLNSAAWTHLSNLPNLLTVRIIEHGDHHPVRWGGLNFAPFLNVTSLDFVVLVAADVLTVLHHSEFPSLTAFTMFTKTLPLADAVQLCRTLSQCKACRTLEYLRISSGNQELLENSDMPLTIIEHFLCFVQLRSLRVAVHFPIYLDNNLLWQAMSSWPHIEILELDDRHLLPRAVTLQGLFSALRLCPHLHTLRVPVDAVDIDIDPNAESFQHTSLQTLHVCRSHIADADAVARIISSILPGITNVGYYLNTVYGWYVVNILLSRFEAPSVASIRHEPNDITLMHFLGVAMKFLCCPSPFNRTPE